jgi:polyisoprenoid-binding protein YceI
MKTTTKLIGLMALLMAVYSSSITAQSLKLNPKFNLTIAGTTNVHDYETKVTQMNGEIVLNGTNQVKTLVVNIPVKSIKSKEKLMDTKTYEAFNAEKHPNITFKMTELQSLQINGADVTVAVAGNLTMNGTTKKVTLKSSGKALKSGVYQFKGAVALKMTDFNMKPPTAMMGMMKVGDGITLKYDVTFDGQDLTMN